MSSQEVAIEVQGSPRENLIQTAVEFLNNPKIRPSPDIQKERFLEKKGLTSEEIRIAFERSNSESSVFPLRHDTQMLYPSPASFTQTTWFQRFKDVTLIIGATYGLYYLYKVYVSPFLFDQSKKPKSIESSMNDINETLKKSIEELKSNVTQVHTELERVLTTQTEQQNYIREISQLKSELATVKGILLSRHQFPSVSLSSTSIPAWQLTGAADKDVKEILDGEDVEHNSGSSETEIVPNSNRNGGSQGSDSSLEMIKEVDVVFYVTSRAGVLSSPKEAGFFVRTNIKENSPMHENVFAVGYKMPWDLPEKVESKGRIQRQDLYHGIETADSELDKRWCAHEKIRLQGKIEVEVPQ